MQPTSSQLSDSLSDLKQCENEPLNFIGSIQNHGCLISFTLHDRRIQSASENVETHLKISHREVVSSKLEHILDNQFVDEVVKACDQLKVSPSPGLLVSYKNPEGIITAGYIYESQGLHCLEIESTTINSAPERVPSDDQLLHDAVVELSNSDTLEKISNILCRTVREITGIDRVMLYRFIPPQFHGEVIAEARVLHAHSYLKHRFPASDIPRIARDLYLSNSVRVIPDINAAISAVSPPTNPKTKAALDLSHSRMRAVSPIHLEYLRNMKIGASYSFAIIVRGELWGLVACHHMEPWYINAKKRTQCELIARTFAAQAPLLEQVMTQQKRIEFDMKLRSVLEHVRVSSKPVSEMFRQHQSILTAFNATGIALVSKNDVDLAGITPTVRQLQDFAQLALKKMNSENRSLLTITSISESFPEWEKLTSAISGALVLKVGGLDEDILVLFRPEHIETIVWSGDPRKQLDKKGFTGRIHPRASFEAWEETIRGYSAPWSRTEVEGLTFLKDMIFETLVTRLKIIEDLSYRNK